MAPWHSSSGVCLALSPERTGHVARHAPRPRGPSTASPARRSSSSSHIPRAARPTAEVDRFNIANSSTWSGSGQYGLLQGIPPCGTRLPRLWVSALPDRLHPTAEQRDRPTKTLPELRPHGHDTRENRLTRDGQMAAPRRLSITRTARSPQSGSSRSCPRGPFPEGLDGLAQRVNGAPGTILNVGVVRFFSVCFTASPASLPSLTLNAIASS